MSSIPVERIVASLKHDGLLVEATGTLPEQVADVTDDSRRVAANGLFIAVHGSARDGHDFLPQAEASGAAAAIVEDPGRTSLPSIVVREGRRAAAIAASAAFDDPAKKLRLLAVTGTNGKTTVVGILRHLLDKPDARSASIGTLGILLGSEGVPVGGGASLTTPGPVELQRALRALVDRGARTVAMELSSHSLDQKRAETLVFEAGVFTNLTRDHLDYHETMEAYLLAKSKLIAQLGSRGAAVVNLDDKVWETLPQANHLITFGRSPDAMVRAESVLFHPRGSEWLLVADNQRHALQLPLIGDFNISNALGAAAAAWHLGMTLSAIAARLRTVPQVAGRLEVIHERPTVLRDYAHTPDALERSLAAVRPFARKKLFVIFGAGGDRDRGKRPLMGAIAEQGADFAIATSDNPRTEEPAAILEDIERGMRLANHEIIEDRREAIKRALELASTEDVVLLAGKGHETYQIRGTISYPFDEKEIVAELSAS
ncbi:MAG: UDP-N-acetylmuramoyl-L-alanyl-D-glutamate--2,6-diaminopimelate ligase [Gemmatimonadaceae bacterium]|nr:UDP-N-acetylmuramoyl-L-alanyl-D-glutamate--2,6-diaminopimelate ligase [Gemmatimonadaceae bacterium]